MILLMHIVIALAGLGIATWGLFTPSIKKIVASYSLIVATALSGTALLFTTGADLLKTCLTGLAYVTVASLITIAAHHKVRRLAAETNKSR